MLDGYDGDLHLGWVVIVIVCGGRIRGRKVRDAGQVLFKGGLMVVDFYEGGGGKNTHPQKTLQFVGIHIFFPFLCSLLQYKRTTSTTTKIEEQVKIH